jgi:poly [ADP-ribose] polymerase
VQDYFNLIPTKIPARPDPQAVISTFMREIGEQEDRLNQLEAAVATLKRTQGGSSLYDSLGAQIERLRWSSDEHKRLVKWIDETSIHGWRPKIRDIFTVTIPFERERFEKNTAGRGKVVQLFHGTRNPNIRHILQQGLRIPKSMSNGWMFGAGIYTANKFTKSGNYCRTVRAGAPSMALIVDVALGKSYIAEGGRHFTQAPQGFDSVMGKAGKTRLGITSSLMNDEFIVYNEAQVTVKYLVAFDGGPRGF